MEVERRILLTDFGTAGLAIVGALLSVTRAAFEIWWVGALVALATVVLAWSEEQGVLGGWATIGLVFAFGVAFIVVGLRFGSDYVAGAALPVALLGLGAGILAYRSYYGLYRPIPERRIRRAG